MFLRAVMKKYKVVGSVMVMYKLEADAGFYSIPATTKDRACFSIVFQTK